MALTDYFKNVIATDASDRQLSAAEAHPKIRYLCAPAESTPIEDRSIDLVTVAQALHWFDVEAFYEEVDRVLRPGGVLAAWCYSWSTISPEIDPIVMRFATETVGPYWPEDRRHIEAGYETLPFRYELIEMPPSRMNVDWKVEDFLSYLRTWSSVKLYAAARASDPVDDLAGTLRPLWGNLTRTVSWPLVLKVGRANH